LAARWQRAQHLKRVFNIDIETFPVCAGAVQIIVCIGDPVVIEKIHTHLDGKTAEPEAPRQSAGRSKLPMAANGRFSWRKGLLAFAAHPRNVKPTVALVGAIAEYARLDAPFLGNHGSVMRSAYFLLGWCFFGLGAVGIVIPGLPTVPFMLIALWLFSKSSQRFHDWLYTHRVFGQPLQQWREHGIIPLKAKLVAVLTMTMSLAYMIGVADVGAGIAATTAVIMLVGLVFILRQPSRLP
jgi:uncharacterized membrane protein YbaN (DUF454 family)